MYNGRKSFSQNSMADDTFKVDLCGKNILFRILHTHLARLKKELARDPLIMKCTTVHIGISRFSFDAL